MHCDILFKRAENTFALRAYIQADQDNQRLISSNKGKNETQFFIPKIPIKIENGRIKKVKTGCGNLA